MRDALNGGGAGSDNPDTFVLELVQASGGVATGIVIIPATGVKSVALVAGNAGNTRQLGPIQRAI